MAYKEMRLDELEVLHAPIRKRLCKIINLVRNNPSLSYEDIARLTCTSRKTAERDLSKLKGSGILVKQGNTRSTSWLVNEMKAEESQQYLAG